MKNIVIMFWSLLLGQVIGYIGGALSQQSYNFILTLAVSFVLGILVILIGHVAVPQKNKHVPERKTETWCNSL